MKECFTKEAIANFLGMTEEEVSDSIRRGVNIYQRNFDRLIDVCDYSIFLCLVFFLSFS